jgi:hypothetical protein
MRTFAFGLTNGDRPMEHDAFRRLLRQQPFQPFRVYVKDGRVYDVRYPRMNLLNVNYVKIGIPEPGSTDPIICDHTEYVRLSEIARVEMLPAPNDKYPSPREGHL